MSTHCPSPQVEPQHWFPRQGGRSLSPHHLAPEQQAMSLEARGSVSSPAWTPPSSLGKVPGRQMALRLVQPWWQLLWGRRARSQAPLPPSQVREPSGCFDSFYQMVSEPPRRSAESKQPSGFFWGGRCRGYLPHALLIHPKVRGSEAGGGCHLPFDSKKN